MSLLETILCRSEELEIPDIEGLRGKLEAYCKHDTEVMVDLLHLLREITN